jgi:hypothetical protein
MTTKRPTLQQRIDALRAELISAGTDDADLAADLHQRLNGLRAMQASASELTR